LLKDEASLTGKYLRGEAQIKRRKSIARRANGGSSCAARANTT